MGVGSKPVKLISPPDQPSWPVLREDDGCAEAGSRCSAVTLASSISNMALDLCVVEHLDAFIAQKGGPPPSSRRVPWQDHR